MALTVGLVMLTIGNFLGGQWANESWGRYWGWDPKETWALISIMVYAFVIHARFVPSLRNKWIFNLMAMYAFVSILFGKSVQKSANKEEFLDHIRQFSPEVMDWVLFNLESITSIRL
jgi:ABC-type transport system involved in cytochrome c biogenesis permease subunit